ncbi:kinase-like domain-containing protein [Rhizophagus irregularis DAOM 181602=DAOM 197198]|nr:kinase-like domain-containing protein [Rhizophagus irregularis DAOM 181602=DAOM 197198]
MAKANETQVPTETEQNNLKIFDKVSNSVNINHKNCSYCSKPFTEELWCKECDPRHMIEDWTSGNNDVDKFIKDTIYDIRNINNVYNAQFLEWVPYHLIEWLATGLKCLHELGYFHKDLHSCNILQTSYKSHISDFGLSGLSNKQKSDDKICRVLPYIAPEVLNGESYTLLSDIYSFALEICNGLRPEFGKGTPEIYKKLAYKCMNANSNQRPTASELRDVFYFWVESLHFGLYKEVEKFGYKGKEIKAIFKEADKEIPNISSSYEKKPDAIYIPENNKDCQDSQLFDLEVSSSLQLKDDASNKYVE